MRTVGLLETGLDTGEVDQMMSRAANYLEDDAETRANKAAYVFSTVIFLLVAIFVVNGALSPLLRALFPWLP